MLNEFLVWAEIDLDAIAHNVSAIKRHVGERVAVMAVVKANAYGHGAEPVARAALESGATWLAVGRVAEGVALRRAGIQAPILVMGYCPDAGAATAIAYDLTLTVTSMGLAEALAGAAARTGRAVPLHVKIDSGMGRFGLLPDAALDFIRGLHRLPGLILEGIYTHFAAADLPDKSYTRRQLATFCDVLAALAREGIQV